MGYQRKDAWYHRAKREGYRSRAAYKLLELDRRLRLFRRGQRVVDLGCAPGGWLQVAAERVGSQGRVVGIDRLACEALPDPQVIILRGDVNDPASPATIHRALGGAAQLVLSDMAPDTSGVGFADHVRSVELVRLAWQLAGRLLADRGRLLAKVFEGEDLAGLVSAMKSQGAVVKRLRPQVTRKASRELYLAISMGTGGKG